MEQTQILAVMGSPSSGKTITSMKIANALAKHKKNVIVVTLDPCCPVIPYLLENKSEQEVSLGELFTQMQVSQNDILKACVEVPNNQYITLLGFKLGESFSSYPKIVANKVIDVFANLRQLADFVIIDCSTVIEADVATIVGLQVADKILKLGTANLKGISYFHTTNRLIADSKFRKEKQISAIGNYRMGQEWEAVAQQYGGVSYLVPYCEELESQFEEQRLFDNLTKETSTPYKLELLKLVGDIFMIDTKKEQRIKNQNITTKERKPFRNPFAKSKGEF